MRSYKKLISALLESCLSQSVLALETQCHSGQPISILFSELSVADVNKSRSYLFRLFVGSFNTTVIK